MKEPDYSAETLQESWNRLHREEEERKRDPEAAAKWDKEIYAENLLKCLAEGDPYGDWA